MDRNDRLFQLFSKNVRGTFERADADPDKIEEIRMRIGAPLFLIYEGTEYALRRNGALAGQWGGEDGDLLWIRREDVEETLQCAVRSSLYAYAEELRQGFITVQGGHRIGLAGRAVLEGNRVRTIQPVTFLNVRVSHEIRGCADRIMPLIYNRAAGTLYHTLLISPPRCGKTTLLRDIIRQVSDGSGGRPGKNVGLVDERSEIGACFQGIPQNDIGRRTDILDCCPKAEGMMMLIRSMAPEVVAVDEIGGQADLEAVRSATYCGCRILATAHGASMEEIGQRPGLRDFLENRMFERYLVLGNERGPGTLNGVFDSRGRRLLCG